MLLTTLTKKVEEWAEARGIYEHSTALAQVYKAVSELGELADAVVKKDNDAATDAIGDITVCLINAAHLLGVKLPEGRSYRSTTVDQAGLSNLLHSMSILVRVANKADATRDERIVALTAFTNDLDYAANSLGICRGDAHLQAWAEIKDRKGYMVPGGAFVKGEQ